MKTKENAIVVKKEDKPKEEKPKDKTIKYITDIIGNGVGIERVIQDNYKLLAEGKKIPKISFEENTYYGFVKVRG